MDVRCLPGSLGLRVLAAALTWSAAGMMQAQSVRVTVPRTAVVSSQIVKLGEVAEISDGDAVDRRQIAALDITERPGGYDQERLSSEQIALRIRLAGIPPDAFSVRGADRVEIKWQARESLEARLLKSLRATLAQRLAVDGEDVQLQLTRPLRATVEEAAAGGETTFEPLLPAVVRTGPQSLRVGMHVDGQMTEMLSVSLNLRLVRDALVAARPLRAGEVVAEQDVRRERRALEGPDAVDFAAEAVGGKLRRSLRPGQVLRQSDLAVARGATASADIVVRPRDTVNVTARKGNLTVSMQGGVALEKGGVGDTIRVRNPTSTRTITARIVAPGKVEVSL